MAGASDAKKGKDSLIAIAFGGPASKPSPDAAMAGEDEEVSEDGHGAAFASFADAVGIPPAGRGRAQAALKQFVKSCMRSGYADEE